MTTAHGEDFSFYQIGFRCCSDTPSATPQAAAKARPATPAAKPASNPGPAVLTGI
jgi:hypothetical protein